jgi:PAS domain S-box-containing protein
VADWNEAAEELFGYSAAEAAGRELDLLVAGPSQKALQEAHRFTEHVESGVPVSATETVRYRKDGTPVDVILGGAPIIIDDTFVGAFVIYTDITEQVQASDALRRSERKFRSLVEQSRDAIVLTDKEGVVVEWNPAAERIFGLEKGAVLGQALWDVQLEIVPTERRTESLKRRMKIALQETLKTGVGTWINRSHEIEIERPNGERRIVQTVSFTIETDDGFRIGSASRDITEEAHAEERVRFQARLLNAVGQAIIVTEPDGTITYWNHAAEELYGWKEDEVLGRNVTSVTPTEASREQASSIMASLNKGEHWAGQFPVRRRDGTTFPAIVSNTPVQDEDGNLAAIIGITTDITEQKRTEERLRQSEIRFRELFDRMSSGVAIYRPKGDGSAFLIEDINRAGQRISQVDREEVVGREVRDVFPGVVELGLFEVLQDVYRTGRSRHHPVAEYEDEDLSQWVENYVYKLPSDEIVAVYDDVTERQQMEEALRESEGQYRSLYNSIRDAILVADTERTIIDCNPAFSDLFGYTLEEIEGKQTHTVYESREEFEALGEALQGHVGDPNFLFTVHYRKKSGEVFPGETNVFYLRNDEGDVTGFIGLIRDVTERQRMERELRESRERYRTLVENQGEGIAIVTPEDRFIFANPTAHDIFGVARGELVGRGLGGFLDEEGRSLVAAQTERRRAGERSTYEIDIVRPDGERRTLLVTASPRPSDDGRFTGTLAVFRDISERKELEKTLEWEAEANSIIARLLRALLGSASIEEISNIVLRGATDLTDSAFGYVGAIDPETRYLVCPTMTREIWDVCDVEDKSIVFEHFGGLWGWVLENREALLTNEPADAPRSSGTPEGHFPVRRFISAPALIDGELVGQVALANAERDYTERDLELVERLADTHALAIQHLRVEEQLREHRENLEEMVEQRTRELREAQEKLFRNQKLTMLGKLAGSINHELRGPLGNIQSGAYFLDMAIEKPDEDVDETVELIQREVDRAESIVSSLLNFVRTREPQREPVDVNSLIEDLLARAEIPEGIDVFRDTDEDIPTILADPEQLQRVFRNLISNAIEAMPEGGHLTVETAQASEELATPEDQILVSISDTGEGIPEENQEKIFEPLFSTKSEGVGLGLALTHMLVEAHKGTIDLESEEGQGSTFRVTLPVAEGENGDV